MAAGGHAATTRRSKVATRCKPLTEAQLAEVRQLAIAMRGAARSVKLHGVVVYLDKMGEQQPAAKPAPPTPAGAQSTDGAATPRKPDDGLTARQRRSRRRLEERVARRAAEQQRRERQPSPQGGDGSAAEAATAAQAERPGRPAPNPSCPAPTAASEGLPATSRAPHPARATRQPARGMTPRGGSRGGGAAAWGRSGRGGKGRANISPPDRARWAPSTARQPMSRADSSEGYSDYSEQSLAPDDLI